MRFFVLPQMHGVPAVKSFISEKKKICIIFMLGKLSFALPREKGDWLKRKKIITEVTQWKTGYFSLKLSPPGFVFFFFA